ncbi:acyltransferase family protein [Oceanobacillus sp. J11TS1]|uniref:acyltransferase family protein n=1 Tax=Oceanobacillus sp. J11TS1 TaxID=2807191 RepID=UPI001B097613|nr:acyltransferase family protein [Oceanobacillus sp. J11TS1]GIO23404.1 acyltransferase [Oceanobacillus sp. J11TS1]
MDTNYIDVERKFRPEIEGLRVVAALLVAVYHIWFGRVSGGVDVFFVVSGFLITTSIISTINRNQDFKFLPYITKLIKRLYPSVLCVLLFVLVLSIFLLPASIFDKTIKEVTASLFYYQNWQLAFSNTDYLNSSQMKTPVEHFWAMSIQGQFYIIWFLLFAGVLYLSKKVNLKNVKMQLNIVLVIVFIVSILYSIYLTEVNQPFAYFITFTRVWEFALGGLLCINLSYIKINKIIAFISGWAGLIGLILTGIIFDVSTSFPGYIALWPMFCAVLIIVSGTKDMKFGVKNLLGTPIMMKLGSLSFGVYLWHWVLLSFYNYHFSKVPSVLTGIIIILVSFILSYVMTKYIEKPIRTVSINRVAFRRLGIMMVTTILIGTSVVLINNAKSQTMAKDINKLDYPGAMAVEDHSFNSEEPIPALAAAFDDLPVSHLDGNNQGLDETDVIVGVYGENENYDATIAVVGSSHSQHWLGAVIEAAKDTNYRVLSITRSGTRFSTGYNDNDLKGQWVNNVTEYIKNNDIDLVISHATAADTEKDRIQQQMIDKLKEVESFGIEVLAVRDTPRYDFNVLEALELEGEEKTVEMMNNYDSQKDEEYWNGFLEKNNSLHVLDLTRYFKVNNEFRPIIGNVIVYRDTDHITNTFSKSFSPIFKEKINEILN